MAISYKRLWKLLINKDVKKKDLEQAAGISFYTIGKLNRGIALGCTMDDITKIIPDHTVKITEGFKVQTVSEFCIETKSGFAPSRTNNEYWDSGTISWVKSGEVHNNITLQTEEHIIPLVEHSSIRVHRKAVAAIIEQITLNTKELALLAELQSMTLAQLLSG